MAKTNVRPERSLGIDGSSPDIIAGIMEVRQSEISGTALIEVEGDIDLFQSRALREAIADLIAAGKSRLIIDLAGVAYIDSSGLGVLISARTQLKKAGGDLKISRITDSVRNVVTLTRLNQLLDFYDDIDEALAAFG